MRSVAKWILQSGEISLLVLLLTSCDHADRVSCDPGTYRRATSASGRRWPDRTPRRRSFADRVGRDVGALRGRRDRVGPRATEAALPDDSLRDPVRQQLPGTSRRRGLHALPAVGVGRGFGVWGGFGGARVGRAASWRFEVVAFEPGSRAAGGAVAVAVAVKVNAHDYDHAHEYACRGWRTVRLADCEPVRAGGRV